MINLPSFDSRSHAVTPGRSPVLENWTQINTMIVHFNLAAGSQTDWFHTFGKKISITRGDIALICYWKLWLPLTPCHPRRSPVLARNTGAESKGRQKGERRDGLLRCRWTAGLGRGIRRTTPPVGRRLSSRHHPELRDLFSTEIFLHLWNIHNRILCLKRAFAKLISTKIYSTAPDLWNKWHCWGRKCIKHGSQWCVEWQSAL